MDIHRAGSRPSALPNPDYFTGTVRFDPVISAPEPARLNALTVTFEPGARTAWHTHPYGQTLIVTSGKGRIGTRGGPVHEIFPGDVIWFAPGEEHWHGAAPDCAMTHIACQEKQGDSAADWLEKVTEEDYLRDPG
ncbi:(R)-mandelonitrile lyase [Marimonas arenosa]|uniref:Cupin domain-containing protein n=1 Tax=Marimonas arenosa TaxID=1795305 RepID=A0AAE4B3I5_9RHOB|nr:cupin domain-containing protein [Marimonas arenosa]MDQ2088414.1 cupin domain-containing protein [Marimonas arenosa]